MSVEGGDRPAPEPRGDARPERGGERRRNRSTSGDDAQAPGAVPAAGREILNIDEAADLLGVSVKTFNKVLHAEDIPARKVGREWKFSRRALIEWVGSGRSRHFYREANGRAGGGEGGEELAQRNVERPADRPAERTGGEKARSRRTAGWQIELD